MLTGTRRKKRLLICATLSAPAALLLAPVPPAGATPVPYKNCGSDSSYQADYKCQGDSDDMQWPVMHVFRRQGGKIVHFWGTELSANHMDTV